MATTTSTTETERPPSTVVNALLGAVVGVVFGFVPFSTVIGGGVAGYLQGTDRRAGLRVGALAGAIMAIPFALVTLAILGIGTFTVVSSGPGMPASSPGIPLRFVAFLLGIVLVAVLYTVGGAALGGYLGAYLNESRS